MGIRITFKLFATLQDYLPAEAKKTNALSLDLDDGTTVAQIVERFALPIKLVHLVLIDGNFVPPGERAPATGAQPIRFVPRKLACPRCGSENTESLSQFGATACKALYRCRGCGEPFEYFKPI